MFSKSIVVAAFAALACAQSTSQAVSSVLSFTRVPNPITAGDATAITYATNDTSSPVTIILRKGPATNLKTIETLTDSAMNGQFIWTPSTSLENGVNYALMIEQGTQYNYFGPFAIQGGGQESSSSSSSTSGSSSGTATASSYPSGTGAVVVSNSSMTTTSYASMGTSTTMMRNTTMSSATLSSTGTRRPTASATTGGAGFQGSQTSSGGAAQQTGAASMVGSSIALVFGAAAVVLMG